MKITKILIKDSLTINKKSVSDKTLESLTDFFLFPNTRYLAIQGNEIVVDDQVLSIYETSTKKDVFVINTCRVEQFYQETTPSFFSQFELHVDDLIRYSISTGIPLKRLTGDYKDLTEFNTQYHDLLHTIYLKIAPTISYIEHNSTLIDPIIDQPSISDKIRAFIEHELNQ